MDFTVYHPILIPLTQQLKKQQLTIATAESCTGGLLAGLLTSLAGSSAWFLSGVVSYSNQSKQDLLKVNPLFIEQHGAVSETVALAMAQGMLAISGATMAIAITGIAGPEGGTLKKPVGTVWIALVNQQGKQQVNSYAFYNKTRGTVRALACESALQQILTFIYQ